MLSEKIKSLNKGKNKDVTYTQVIEELIKSFQKQKEKLKNDIDTPNEKVEKNNFNLYFGKDNLEEENIILNELDENYYNDIVELNKTNKIGGQGNITCILIKLNKDKDINKEEKIKVEKEKAKEESKTPDDKNKLKEEEKKEESKDNKIEDSKENTKNE